MSFLQTHPLERYLTCITHCGMLAIVTLSRLLGAETYMLIRKKKGEIRVLV